MYTRNFKEVIAASPCIFTIGVAGDSGSGKTTFTSAIRRIFGNELVSTVTLDDYHLYGREERKRLSITPLSPSANDIGKLEQDIARLKGGDPVEKMKYNHETGKLEGPFVFEPAKIIIFEGLHTLFTPKLRALLDFTLFVDPDDEIKYQWKKRRDIGARGYSAVDVEDEIGKRSSDYRQYIAPQRAFADAVIKITSSVFGKEKGVHENIYRVTLFQVPLERRIRDLSLNIDLFSLLSLSDRDFLLEFSVKELDGREMGALTFDGQLPYGTVRRLEQNIEEQTMVCPLRMFEEKKWVTAGDIIQLVLSWRIINRRIFIQEEHNGTCWNK
jgi:phosphoribulokinase